MSAMLTYLTPIVRSGKTFYGLWRPICELATRTLQAPDRLANGARKLGNLPADVNEGARKAACRGPRLRRMHPNG